MDPTEPVQEAVESVQEAAQKVGDIAVSAPSETVQTAARSLESVLAGVEVELKRLNDHNERTIKEATAAAVKVEDEPAESVGEALPEIEVKNPPKVKRKFGARGRK